MRKYDYALIKDDETESKVSKEVERKDQSKQKTDNLNTIRKKEREEFKFGESIKRSCFVFCVTFGEGRREKISH